MVMRPSGKFGEFVKQYEKARRPYSREAFDYFKSLIKIKNPLILDLGCGTGISTRQLVRFGTVIGCDPDPIMLAAAKKHKNSGVQKYVVGYAHKIPFRDKTFDIVTAFSSFHWFDDKKSVAEIRRVLKPGGLFFVSGRAGSKRWGQGYRAAIIKSIHRQIAQFVKTTRNHYSKEILIRSGFKDVKTKTWKKSEFYTLKNALEYVQSVSIWETVPKKLWLKALKGLEEYFKNILERHGKIERQFTLKAVVGVK